MAKHKISEDEQSILNRLIFPENYGTILEETGLQYGELRDGLINLLNFGFIEAQETGGKKVTLSGFYDADNLQKFTFRATGKGLAAM